MVVRPNCVTENPTGRDMTFLNGALQFIARRENEMRLRLEIRDGDSGFWDWNLRSGAPVAKERWCSRRLSADFVAQQHDSLGLQLVASLAQQLGGSLEVGADGHDPASPAAASAVFSVTLVVALAAPSVIKE